MKGKTIVHLHIDTAYGREPLPAMRQIAKDWGFKLIEIAGAASGPGAAVAVAADPPEKADWVTFWGAGSGMNSTAITTAARVGFPRDKMIYVTFGGAEEDMIPAGDAAKGTYVAANAVPGKRLPADRRHREGGLRRRQGQHAEPGARRHGLLQSRRRRGGRCGSRRCKNAQKIHNKVGKTVNGAEFRDGYEALDITDAKLKELGIDGMSAPFKMSCAQARRCRALQDDAVGRQEVPDRDRTGCRRPTRRSSAS